MAAAVPGIHTAFELAQGWTARGHAPNLPKTDYTSSTRSGRAPDSCRPNKLLAVDPDQSAPPLSTISVTRTVVAVSPAKEPAIPGPWEGGAEIRRRATQGSWRRIAHKDVYRAFSELGIDYGPFFRRIERVDIEANHAFGRLVGTVASISSLETCSIAPPNRASRSRSG
jgi:hypothetical protein